jgi:hypothetical protein
MDGEKYATSGEDYLNGNGKILYRDKENLDRAFATLWALGMFFNNVAHSEDVINMFILIEQDLRDRNFVSCKHHYEELSGLIIGMHISMTQMVEGKSIAGWIRDAINALDVLISSHSAPGGASVVPQIPEDASDE